MARGGSRTAKPGTLLPNRSDMRSTQSIKAAGTGVYGSVTDQENQLRAIPLENTAGVTNSMAQQASQQNAVFPGELGGFHRPTDRPNEPVTAGVDIGAGPGSALLQGSPQSDDAEDIATIAKHLPTLELLANMPDASAGMRNFVRRLRGGAPS